MALQDISSASPMEPFNKPSGFELNREPSGHYALKIWGRFQLDWIAGFSSGLSKHRISIIGATAKKVKAGWLAEFEIMATRSATDPNKIDYLALALARLETDMPVTVSLDEFVLGDPQEHNGALYLEVKAQDQIGFLGALLNRFAFYSLFPESMIIETLKGRIFDRFWIKGVGGQTPSDSAIITLKKKLEGYLSKKSGE